MVCEEALGLINLRSEGDIGVVINDVSDQVDALLDITLVTVYSVGDLFDDLQEASFLSGRTATVPAHLCGDRRGSAESTAT